MLLNKLRAMTREEAAELPGCQEGLDRSLLKAAASASSREELLALLTTRRYPAARLSRLCTYALLGVTQKMLENAPLPDRALLLALKKNPSLTGCWKDISVRVCNASEWLSSADPVEKTAWRLWSLASGYTDSWPFSQKLTVR